MLNIFKYIHKFRNENFQICDLLNQCIYFRYINGTRLDDRIVRTDWDAGFIEGRQYGRGKTGGQVILV